MTGLPRGRRLISRWRAKLFIEGRHKVKLKRLGRGLDALLAGDMESVSAGDALRTLKVEQLQPGKYQPRTQMDQESLSQLADSIRAQGIMQPILVRAVGGDFGGQRQMS